jgi:hypothetical protein
MDGIGLELWTKKLLLCRYKRQREYHRLAELSLTSRAFATEPLPTALYQAAAENLDQLTLHWKETFQSAWLRQKPDNPEHAAGQAQGEILTWLSTEQKQIENEITSFAAGRGLNWKPEELLDGKTHLDQTISQLRLNCRAQIADAKAAREDDLARDAERHERHRGEVREIRVVSAVLVVTTTLVGAWLGATLNARRSTADRQYIDERMKVLSVNQRQMEEALANLHRSNRKLAFWTEKTADQLDKEMDDARSGLTQQIADIKEETARKIARVESEYARTGRDGGAELDMRRQGLIHLQDKLIAEARDKSEHRLAALQEQKSNIMR